MKKILIAFCFPLYAASQSTHCTNRLPIAAGLTVGYSSKNCAVGEMMIGLKPAEHIVIYPLSIKVHSRMSDPSVPVIFESRAGVKFGPVELYGGYGYHFAGQDGKQQYKQYEGLKPGAGIILHVAKMLIVTGGMSGNVYTLQFGIFNTK